MTGPGALIIEPLIKRHNRTAFSCGIPALDHYLVRRAGQDVRRRVARVFVCTAVGADAVLGFYTLSALSIDVTSLPERLSRKLPRHPVPCALIGRLAVDQGVNGNAVAGAHDALNGVGEKHAAQPVPLGRSIVDAKNDEAKPFYEGFWFTPLRDDPMRLFLPLGSVALRGSNK